MVIAVYLPLVLSAIFGLLAPALARRLPPRLGIWLASGGAVVCAAGLVVTLGLLGFTLVAQNPFVAARGGWDARSITYVTPVATPVAVAALVVVAALGVRLVLAARHRTRELRAAFAIAAALPCPSGELAVLDDPGLQAWAVPGHPGRIVVSSALLRTLDAQERRAVIAHERAHLRHRHHVHHAVAQLAVAANPLLWRLPAAVELAAERSADEDAARVSSRTAVASALLHASVPAVGGRALPSGVFGVASSDVVLRVRELRRPARRPALWRVAVLLGLLALTVAAMVEAIRDTNLLFVAARAWQHRGR